MSAFQRLPLIRTRSFTAASAAGVLVAGLSTGFVGVPSSAAPAHEPAPGPAVSHTSAKPSHSGNRGRDQTSDGKPGIVVGPALNFRGRAVQVKNDFSYQIAPGVVLREWDQVDGRMPVGQVRMNLLSIDLDAPNLSFEELSPKYVTSPKKVSQLGRWNSALGAVNGDFFDISQTGAPLGVAINSGRGLLNGSREGWLAENSSLWFDGAGPHLGPLSVQYALRQHPDWIVSGVNHPEVPAGEIGLFSADWGKTKGYDVTTKRRAREVVLRKNRVISNKPKLSTGLKIGKKDRVLVGAGRAAGQLKELKIGAKITVARRVEGGRPSVAITGDRALLVNGVRTVVNDSIAHPRTAVGIDADGRRLLILVVDGRSSVSRGYTMVELASVMAALGAENALNLDGGGSSAMYARGSTGAMGIVNEPSDGGERRVANSFGVVYHGELPPVTPIAPPVPTPTQ